MAEVHVLKQASTTLSISTRGPGFIDLTGRIEDWVDRIGAREGLLTAFVRHTSASLTIQENADPDVQRDLLDALDRLAPRSHAYRHGIEGPDDMPAHIRSMLTTTSIGIPIVDGRPVFGTWQALYLIEHRDTPHRREVVLQFIGEVRSA
jgi:secondary thiamine-phosphate synthase enzyme